MHRYIVVIIVLCQFSFSQVSKLIEIEKRYINKVEVGMSANEVKKVIGRPKAIESGFPQSESMIITELPDLVGQLNNSTWFYYYPKTQITIKDSGYTKFYIHDMEVEYYIYDDYKDDDSLWIYEGKVVSKQMAAFYQKISDKNLQYQKQFYDPRKVTIQPSSKKITLYPILCVVFDKGTQVVASTKVLFQIIK